MAFLDESGLAYLWNKIKTRYDGVVATFKGATSSTAGARGLVPAPAVGQQSNVLKGDGTWGTCDAVTLNGVAPSIGGSHVFPFIPVVRDDGVMEVGKFMDFHDASGESNDYSTRVISSDTGLTIQTNQPASILAFTNGNTSGYMQLDAASNFNFPTNDLFCRDHRLIRDDEVSGNNSTSGWIRHPTGVIILWVKSSNSNKTLNFPRALGAVYSASIVTDASACYIYTLTTTSLTLEASGSSGTKYAIVVGRE